ncbi:MAG: ATP-binding cassette domain-containing protein [Geminicoccaceae bacterium]
MPDRHPVADDSAALAVDQVSFAYERGKPVLSDVSIAVPRGRVCALLGPNGAGKTTLLALITRLFRTRSGRIRIGAHDLGEAPMAALAELGVVFQQPSLDLDLSVRQNLFYAGRLRGLSDRTIAAGAERLGAQLDFRDRMDQSVRTLSGGYRRRVEIARALLHEPAVLVLDEATVGLDIDSRQALVALAHELATAQGIGVLWTTHLIDEIGAEDRVIVLDRGHVRAQGDRDEVIGAHGSLADAFRALTAKTPGP